MSNWAENPKNQKQSLMQFTLPSLLFSECHKYCVDFDLQAAQTKEQATCINNCQEKTYKAFDLYLITSQSYAQRRDYRHYVDISKYTGMEIEHSHDTSSAYKPDTIRDHYNPKQNKGFVESVQGQYGDLKDKALK